MPHAPAAASVSLADGQPNSELSELVTQLSSEKWEDRSKAQNRLARFGDEARPALEAILQNDTTPDVRLQAIALLDRIAAIPPAISLRLDRADARRAVRELSKQAGTQIEFVPADLPEKQPRAAISIDADHVSFCVLLADLANRLGLDVGRTGGGWQLRARDVSAGRVRITASGAFLLIFRAYTRPPLPLELRIEIYPDPRLVLLQAQSDVELDEVTDDRGRSLLPSVGLEAMPLHNGFALTSGLRAPSVNASKIARCAGTATLVAARTRTVVYPAKSDDPPVMEARDVSLSTGNLHCVMASTRATGDQYETWLKVELSDYTPNKLDAVLRSVQASHLRVYDGGGRAMECERTSVNRTRRGADVKLLWSAEPRRIEWDAPITPKEVRVPFLIEDVGLP